MIYPIICDNELVFVDTELEDCFPSGKVSMDTFYNIASALTNQANEQFNDGYDTALEDVLEVVDDAESKDDLIMMIRGMLEDD